MYNISYGFGVVVVKDGRFLTAKRREGCSGGVGLVALPGGKIDFGEPLFHAVVREVLEETGLIVVPLSAGNGDGHVFHVGEHISNGEHHVSFYVAARVVGGTLSNREPDKHGPWLYSTPAKFRREVEDKGVSHWVPIGILEHYGAALGF